MEATLMLRMIVLCVMGLALGFGKQEQLPTFEVATVRVDHSVGESSSESFLPSGQVLLEHRTIESMITEAWKIEDRQIAEAPSWLRTDRYDVAAKAVPGTPPDTRRLMLRALLIERFGLKAHIEDRLGPSYSLVLGRGKLALRESDGMSSSHGCTPGSPGSRGGRTCIGVTMPELADLLSVFAPLYIDPVVDMTGLKGKYDFVLVWTRLTPGKGLPSVESDPNQRTLEDVVRDLGLLLRPERRLLPTLVIEHIIRDPSEQ
jgi:uncharacterized protein (TIGR03435 family)